VLQEIPLGRFAELEEIAKVIVFLAEIPYIKIPHINGQSDTCKRWRIYVE
jgi:NAD(P)-dependent dehydrogenase (short-subunit alcohol dehydrogenase family)